MALKTPVADPRNSYGTYGQRAYRSLWPIRGYEVWRRKGRGKARRWVMEVVWRKPLPPRETFPRDRSLRGKARIRARREANKASR